MNVVHATRQPFRERLRSSLLRGARRAVLTIVSVATAAEGQSRGALRVDAPAEVVGDGATPVVVRVSMDPFAVGNATGLTIELNAGRLGIQKVVESGVVDVTVVPPRVVEGIVWTIRVASRHGQQGKADIRLLPAIPKVEFHPSDGALHLHVPKHLILGRDEEALLSFHPSTVAPVTLVASAGSISSVQSEGRDGYKAIYRPPADKLPRVALIVAFSDDGAIVDWAPIQLFGSPLVSATSEPNATVLARVAGEEYGPVQADRRGRVELRVLA
ncbi:MAG TPA: hypothetical protein VIV60_00650, partial [Polyangiaceae bacterium]